jgi:DHA2 family multidrug resistance protein
MTFATLSPTTMGRRHGNFQPHSQHRHLGVQTLLTQHTRIVHSSLVENITRFNPLLQNPSGQMPSSFAL